MNIFQGESYVEITCADTGVITRVTAPRVLWLASVSTRLKARGWRVSPMLTCEPELIVRDEAELDRVNTLLNLVL